jgi:hypothetical protein
MTRYTPLWQQAGSYPANYDRVLLGALWPAPGAAGARPAPVPNTMNVSIPSGVIAVPLQSGQYSALCRWDAAEVVSSPAAPAAGQSRIDLVVCQVRDPLLDSGVNNDFIFLVVAGTPTTGTPVTPTAPPNSTSVASYVVPGGAANLNGVQFFDGRRGLGTVPVVNGTAERDAIFGPTPPRGALCYVMGAPDTDTVQYWNGSAWTNLDMAAGRTALNCTASGTLINAGVVASMNWDFRDPTGWGSGPTITIPYVGCFNTSMLIVAPAMPANSGVIAVYNAGNVIAYTGVHPNGQQSLSFQVILNSPNYSFNVQVYNPTAGQQWFSGNLAVVRTAA